jgi:hypothetical protein
LAPSDRRARALVSPVTERHLFTWRRLATLLGADHKAVQRWHAQGVAMIVAALGVGRTAHRTETFDGMMLVNTMD